MKQKNSWIYVFSVPVNWCDELGALKLLFNAAIFYSSMPEKPNIHTTRYNKPQYTSEMVLKIENINIAYWVSLEFDW